MKGAKNPFLEREKSIKQIIDVNRSIIDDKISKISLYVCLRNMPVKKQGKKWLPSEGKSIRKKTRKRWKINHKRKARRKRLICVCVRERGGNVVSIAIEILIVGARETSDLS